MPQVKQAGLCGVMRPLPPDGYRNYTYSVISEGDVRIRSGQERRQQGQARDRLRRGASLWLDDGRIVIASAQQHRGEDRQLVIEMMFGRIWTAIVTERDIATRIISVRRARDYEEVAYEQANTHHS